MGAAPLFTVGTAYLDDIVRPKHVPIHLGLAYLLTVVGPALGYGLGGAFLSIYVDPWLETDLQPEDPGWVGAWWLCFIFSAVVSWLLAIPFLLFPRLLPDSHLVKKERELEMAQKYKGKYGLKEDTDLITKLKSFPYHLKQVVMTLSWWFITAAICSSIIVLSGMVSFAPKYLESQFTLTASSASLISGGVGKWEEWAEMCISLRLSLSFSLSLAHCLSFSLSLSHSLYFSIIVLSFSLTYSHSPVYRSLILSLICHAIEKNIFYNAAIPAGGAGVIAGALIIYFTKSKGRQVALINWIVSLLIILPVLVFLVHCPTLNLSGITVPYSDG